MRKRYLIPIFACILLLSCCTVALAHPGDTDANGGHYDHSTGEYHYHHATQSISTPTGNALTTSMIEPAGTAAVQAIQQVRTARPLFYPMCGAVRS